MAASRASDPAAQRSRTLDFMSATGAAKPRRRCGDRLAHLSNRYAAAHARQAPTASCRTPMNRTLTPGSARDPLWCKDAIIYELHVKTFFDANGDGVGDFTGLIEKLDYLDDLGVACLWLLPFYESPFRDDGYDIAHYERVHPLYGRLADFKRFLDEAHARGLQVITELVINHTSDQHPWFQAARRAPAGSLKRNFYVWSDTDQRYLGARVIFHDVEPSNWTWDPVAGAYHLAPVLPPSAGSQFRKPACACRRVEGHALLARHGRGRTTPRCHAAFVRARGDDVRQPARNACVPQRDSRRNGPAIREPGAPRGGESVARRCAACTSATATSVTWRSTFR